MSAESYNGWSNYPTWCVNLWLSNDEGLYNLVREQAQERLADDAETASYQLAGWLKDDLCQVGSEYGLIPELEGFADDLMGYALSAVNWNEIADSWIDDAKDES